MPCANTQQSLIFKTSNEEVNKVWQHFICHRGLSTIEVFQPSIAFVSKDGAYQSGAPYNGFTDGGLLTTIYFL
jgi:hypothetical protein